ncbi:MAG: hypothetical protein ACLUOF_12625 [Ruminococcus sp.]
MCLCGYSDQGEVLYGWLVRGSQLTATGDWTLGQNVTVTEDGGVQISGNGVWYGTLQVGGTFDYDPAGGDDSSGDTTQPADTTPGTSDDAASAPERRYITGHRLPLHRCGADL